METKKKENKMLKQKIIGAVAGFIYRLYSFTFRYKVTIPDEVIKDYKKKERKKGDGVLLAFWHQDELALLPYFSYKQIVVLVSTSKDGTIMTTAL